MTAVDSPPPLTDDEAEALAAHADLEDPSHHDGGAVAEILDLADLPDRHETGSGDHQAGDDGGAERSSRILGPTVDKYGGDGDGDRIAEEVARAVDKAAAGGPRGWKKAKLEAERAAADAWLDALPDPAAARAAIEDAPTDDEPVDWAAMLGLRPVGVIAAEVDAEPPPRWLFRPVWPGGSHGVLAAGWKVGKTWLMVDAAVAVAAGTPWLGLFPADDPGTVLVFLGEGGKRKMTRRGRAVAAHYGVVWDDLPIHLSERVPHLTDDAHVAALVGALDQHRPRLVIIDPLYLAAKGASGSSLYDMGAVLEPAQLACQQVGAALMVAHHNNRDTSRSGSQRMSGAGPAEWGRVLVSVDRKSYRTDDATGATDAVLSLDLEGDEITGGTYSVRRQVWADDRHDLASPLHYTCEPHDDDVPADDGPAAGMQPSRRRVYGVLADAGDYLTVTEIGDRLAEVGHQLKKRTIQDALAELRGAGLVEPLDADVSQGQPWAWRATEAGR